MSELRIATPEDVEADAERLRAEYSRLFALAHEMARVLLSLEHVGSKESGGRADCPVCAAEPFECHDEDCALDTVLRKAGAR